MDEEQTQGGSIQSEQTPAESAPKKLSRIRSKRTLVIAIVVVIVALGVVAYFYKGLFVAATVGGSPISRLAVIHKLEKYSGRKVLDSLITEKLIEKEALAKGVTVNQEEVDGEIKKIESQLGAQNMTLDSALEAENITRKDFEKQITTQKKVEKLLADKIQVSDDEVAQYIQDNKIAAPEGQESEYKDNIRSQLTDQKLSAAFQSWLEGLRSQANIRYFVNY